jgi:hypothetical protein
MSQDISSSPGTRYVQKMKKLINTYRSALDYSTRENGAIVLPAVLWWLGVPLTLLVLLWVFGMF